MPQICEIWAVFPSAAAALKLQAQCYPEGLLLFRSPDPPNQTVWVTAGLSLSAMKGSSIWTGFGICNCGPIDTRLQPARDGYKNWSQRGSRHTVRWSLTCSINALSTQRQEFLKMMLFLCILSSCSPVIVLGYGKCTLLKSNAT